MKELTTQEWIEYYRFHPSEFESFIKYVEDEISKRNARLEELEAAAREYRNCTSGIRVHQDYCMFCESDISELHKDDCKYLLAEQKLAALLNASAETKNNEIQRLSRARL